MDVLKDFQAVFISVCLPYYTTHILIADFLPFTHFKVKQVYINGIITAILNEQDPWEPACPSPSAKCDGKVTFLKGKWHCNTCKQSYEACGKRYVGYHMKGKPMPYILI